MTNPGDPTPEARSCSKCGIPVEGAFYAGCGHRHESPVADPAPAAPVGTVSLTKAGKTTSPLPVAGRVSLSKTVAAEAVPPVAPTLSLAKQAAGGAAEGRDTEHTGAGSVAGPPVQPATPTWPPQPHQVAQPTQPTRNRTVWALATLGAVAAGAVAGYLVWGRAPEETQLPSTTVVAGAPSEQIPAPSVTIKPASPSPTPTPTPTVEPNVQALADLQTWRDDSLANTSLDGRWVLQLASKYPGVVDESQAALDGGSRFEAADIHAQFRQIADDMEGRGIPVIQLLDSDFGTKHSARSGTIWTLLADPGGISDRAAGERACADLYPNLSEKALRNVCLPRRLIQP